MSETGTEAGLPDTDGGRTFTVLRNGTADAKRLMEALNILEARIVDCRHMRPDTAAAAFASRRELVTAIVGSLHG